MSQPGLCYKCLRCKQPRPKELRRSKRRGNNRDQFLALETQINESKILHLQERYGAKILCPACLRELSVWLVDKSAQVVIPSSK
jgi:hypothetical protein